MPSFFPSMYLTWLPPRASGRLEKKGRFDFQRSSDIVQWIGCSGGQRWADASMSNLATIRHMTAHCMLIKLSTSHNKKSHTACVMTQRLSPFTPSVLIWFLKKITNEAPDNLPICMHYRIFMMPETTTPRRKISWDFIMQTYFLSDRSLKTP